MLERAHIIIQGAVQGVGFRPFIYRLAHEVGVYGWVNNGAQGVTIEAEASRSQLEEFVQRIHRQKPPHSFIQQLEVEFLPPLGYDRFEIRHSQEEGRKTAFVLPDLATCPECLREIFDPTNRRYRYPFTNCTHCGPRLSIIQALPYDRSHTTMRDFIMCEECRAEYENPLDRRFHAQPNACPRCGPQLALWNRQGKAIETGDDALLAAVEILRSGSILGVKGLGGFHLMVDARNSPAVAELRRRKHREAKPLALMYPTLEYIYETCEVSALEEQLLRSAEAPIVLLSRKDTAEIAPEVAPGNPYLGVMLPYTPLHHLLMQELGLPVVATSGNFSGEPICTDEYEALERLGDIVDLFLVHNRPIARHVDDSIVRVTAGREQVLRRARGYAPLPLELPGKPAKKFIATGAHLKNATAININNQVFPSQHIGDLDTPESCMAFRRVVADFQHLYELKPDAAVCDLHPDYHSTHYAETLGLPIVRVQHHYAHVLACMVDNHLETPMLGVAWDGTGYGLDGTVWGGEFLYVPNNDREGNFTRVAHFQTFRLPGGDAAVREPRRSALGLLYEIYGDDLPSDLPTVQAFSTGELAVLKSALRKGINAPVTSSAGRLFDATASMIGLRQRVEFEGQAAMELEFAAAGWNTDECYPFEVTPVTDDKGTPCHMINVQPLVLDIVNDMRVGISTSFIAAKYHNTLAEIILAVARLVGEPKIGLTGGCFQNKTLLERTVDRLKSNNFQPYWHWQIPANDGGIAVGQIMAALREK